MRKEIDLRDKQKPVYRWFDVVLEKELAHRISFNSEPYPLRLDWNLNPSHQIGQALNIRVEGDAMLCDVVATKELKGLYPGLCYQILTQEIVGGKNLDTGKLLYIGAAGALNVDETLEPFI